MNIKRFLIALSFLAFGKQAQAVTNGAVAISSGTAFYTVDTSSMANTNVRQNIVIGDPSLQSGLAPVSSVTGLTVNLASSTAAIGTVQIATGGVSAFITGGSIANTTFQATQPNAYNVVSSNTVLGTGSAAIGSITNTGFTVSTGGVTSAQGPPGTLDWHVTQSTNAVTGTVTISTGGVTVTQATAANLNTLVTQGTAGTADWSVKVTSTNVSQSTVTIMAPNNNTTAIPVSGSFSASFVNITTATPNTSMPIAGVEVGGIGPDGHFQTFAVDISSQLKVSGTISATSVSMSTAQVNTTQPGIATYVAGVGPTGLIQTFRTSVSSDIWVNAMIVSSSNTVTISTGGVTVAQGPPATADWKVTQSTNVLSAGNNAIGSVWSTSTYVVNPTTSPMQIQGADGTLIGVGWQNGGSSVPVSQISIGSITYANNFFKTIVTTNSVVVSSNVFGMGGVSFNLYPGTAPVSGTLMVVVFEISPDSGTNWYPINCYQQGSEVVSSSYTLNAATTTWTANLFGAYNFRLRLANYQSGIPWATITPLYYGQPRSVTANLTVQTMSNGMAMPLSVGYQSGGSSVPVNVLNTSFAISTGGVNVTGTVTVSTGGVTVTQATAGNLNMTASQSGTWTVNVATGGITVGSTDTVQGMSPDGVTIQGNPIPIGAYVSSAAWPTQNADGQVSHVLVDDLGRMIVKQGASQGEILFATATLTTTATTVIISSATSSTRNYLCGIIIINTSATNTNVQIFPAGNPTAVSTSVPLETPTVQNAGFRADCGNPILKSNFGSAISVQPAASVSSLLISAQYYVGP